jgi:uncharacterized protein YkwD
MNSRPTHKFTPTIDAIESRVHTTLLITSLASRSLVRITMNDKSDTQVLYNKLKYPIPGILRLNPSPTRPINITIPTVLLRTLAPQITRPTQNPTNTNTPVPNNTPSYLRDLLNLHNQERAKRGAPALRYDTRLAQAALDHGQDLVRRNYFSHQSPEGEWPQDRTLRRGYPGRVSENLARTVPASFDPRSANADWALNMWRQSPGHWQNAMDPTHTDFGAARVQDSQGRYIWVVDFGTTKLPPYNLVRN